MRFSIITVCYNAGETIEKSILSVIDQTFKDMEYIIIDGASQDKTQQILDKYRSRIQKIETGKDRGIYHAMNKGIGLASGEWIAFLNADDTYLDNRVLEQINKLIELNDGTSDIFYGNLLVYNVFTGRGYIWKPGPVNDLYLYRGMLPHPAMFVKRELFERVGKFDEAFSIAGDYEWTTRAYRKFKTRFKYLDVLPVKFSETGKSNSEEGHRISISERKKIREMYYSGFYDKLYFPIRNRLKKTIGL